MHPSDTEARGIYEAIIVFFLERLGRDILLAGDTRIPDITADIETASIALAEALKHRGGHLERTL